MKKDILGELEYRLRTENLTREEKMRLIKEAGDEYNRQIDKELNSYLAKQYAGAVLELGSVAIPVGAGLNLSGKILAPVGKKMLSSKPVQQVVGKAVGKSINSALTALETGAVMNSPHIFKGIQSKIGRKYTTDIYTSGIDSAINGGVYGFGRGLVEGENPFKTSAQDAAFGLGIGGALGGVSGKIEKTALANKLKAYKPIAKPIKSDKKQHIKDVNNYYKSYEQGVSTNRDDIGNIKLVSLGMKETNKQKFDKAAEVVDLSKNLRQAKYIGEELPVHDHKNFDIQKFHRLSDGRNDYLITENSKGEHYFYKITDSTLTGPEPEGWNPSTIIPDILTGYNSPKYLNPRLNVGIESLQRLPEVYNTTQSAINDYVSGNTSYLEIAKSGDENVAPQSAPQDSAIYEPSPIMIKGGVEYNQNTEDLLGAPTGYASNISNNDHIFTPEEIGAMTPEEFTQNEGVIMNQLKQGQIQPRRIQNYAGYVNPVTGDNKIYTSEDIGTMSVSEYTKNEAAINSQLQSIGVPSTAAIQGAVSTGDVIYVNPYTRSDGTPVRGYYRSR